MRLTFDPDFDEGSWPGPLGGREASAGEEWVGAARFAHVLATALGLGGPALSLGERAARLLPAVRATKGFWSESADVDPFAAARRLIQWRDILVMAGWRGGGKEARLAELGALAASVAPGLPDCLLAIHDALARRSPGIESVELLSPRGDLEPLWQRTFDLLEQQGTRVVETTLSTEPAREGTDLAALRAGRFSPTGDGSLRLLRPAGPLAAAEEVAAWLASLGNPTGTVVVGSDPALDAALHRHGLPTTGLAYALRDDGPLQILPLVLDLGWRPPDPQRAYELLSLPSGPVPGEVARRLRAALGTWPAVDSDAWREALHEGLEAIEDPDRRERVKRRLDVLWDARVDRTGRYPVAEVVRRASMLRNWILARGAVAGDNEAAWGAAAAQSNSLLELVQHSGMEELTAAQLQRLVIEATHSSGGDSPFEPQAGIAHVGKPGGVAGPARVVVWWRFDHAAAPGIGRLPLTRAERVELESLGVRLPNPARVAEAHARRWRRPIDQATGAVLLVCPERDSAGREIHPHPLWDELASRVDAPNARRVAERTLVSASLAGIVSERQRERLPLPSPRASWTVPAGRITVRDKESPTSVQMLLECPFQWVLKYAGRLYEGDSAQVEDGTSPRLLGDLLHAIMNRLFAGPQRSPEEAEREAGAIFDAEGPRLAAALFLPGAEAQRNKVRRAATATARTLYALMASKGLRVVATEQERTGRAFGTTLAGRVDLVLGNPPRILDLKWSGAKRKRDALKEGTAVQLAVYSFLEGQANGTFPPVGYFVMDEQCLLTTDPQAFAGAEGLAGPSPDETWKVAEDSHRQKWETVAGGTLEAPGAGVDESERSKRRTSIEGGRLVMEFHCRWCDYTVLCGLAFEEPGA